MARFTVSICLGGGDGWETVVEVPTTENEDKRLEYCRNNFVYDISNVKGLKRLYKKIISEVRYAMRLDAIDKDDYNRASFIVRI